MSVPIFIAGHSLGAARAFQYAYARMTAGLRVDGIYAFASPNPGNAMIGVRLAPLFIRSFRNGRDLVPEVPVDLPWLGEEYVQPRPFETMLELPADPSADPVFKWHHMDCYLAGARKMPEPLVPPAVSLGDAAEQTARLYLDDAGWDWASPSDGPRWAMKVMPNGARLMISRGTADLHDWLDDLDAAEIDVMGARMSRGFWAGVAPLRDQLDAILAPR